MVHARSSTTTHTKHPPRTPSIHQVPDPGSLLRTQGNRQEHLPGQQPIRGADPEAVGQLSPPDKLETGIKSADRAAPGNKELSTTLSAAEARQAAPDRQSSLRGLPKNLPCL